MVSQSLYLILKKRKIQSTFLLKPNKKSLSKSYLQTNHFYLTYKNNSKDE